MSRLVSSAVGALNGDLACGIEGMGAFIVISVAVCCYHLLNAASVCLFLCARHVFIRCIYLLFSTHYPCNLSSQSMFQVTSIPAGFEHSTILFAGRGVANTVSSWGQALLSVGGKQRMDGAFVCHSSFRFCGFVLIIACCDWFGL